MCISVGRFVSNQSHFRNLPGTIILFEKKICKKTNIKSDESQNVTLEHKTSHNGQFSEIEINASSESWINNISIDVWFGQYL